MKSLCLFASYFTSRDLPYYIEVYLKELRKHYGEVILLSSQENLSDVSCDFLKREGISLIFQVNAGFDFGQWHRAFQKVDIESYDRIILVNDSCVLFSPLTDFIKWSDANKSDFQGMTCSEAIAPHLQSYFLVINKRAIQPVRDYLNQNGLLQTISEVIRVYEVGMSTFLLNKGLTMAAFVDNNGYKGEFSPYYHCLPYHLKKGIPLIKVKILFSSYRKDELFTLARMNFNINPEHYVALIKQLTPALILDFAKLQPGKHNQLRFFSKLTYEVQRKAIAFFRPFYNALFKR